MKAVHLKTRDVPEICRLRGAGTRESCPVIRKKRSGLVKSCKPQKESILPRTLKQDKVDG